MVDLITIELTYRYKWVLYYLLVCCCSLFFIIWIGCVHGSIVMHLNFGQKKESSCILVHSHGTLHRDAWQKKINRYNSPLYIEGIVNFQDIRFNKCLALYLNICVTFYTSYLLMIQSTSNCHPNLENRLYSQFLPRWLLGPVLELVQLCARTLLN